MADVTARLVSALVTRLSPEGADETTRRERALLAVRLLCSRIRPRVSLDPVHVRHLIASLLARNRISTIAFDELFEKLMRMRVIEHKASVLYLMYGLPRTGTRDARGSDLLISGLEHGSESNIFSANIGVRAFDGDRMALALGRPSTLAGGRGGARNDNGRDARTWERSLAFLMTDRSPKSTRTTMAKESTSSGFEPYVFWQWDVLFMANALSSTPDAAPFRTDSARQGSITSLTNRIRDPAGRSALASAHYPLSKFCGQNETVQQHKTSNRSLQSS
ncbi:hypothetical protein PBRA_007060 [Plasmodiophora brassicae]|uniref:Uncharacterized protein n=1 Tax=Plasmodiophora brassicae TaxID=37360 RepID=A0A0G4IV09_PLABS|nr:hypothetical protein PBRA_007060 [Plasmodiophora brassicae]